MHLADVPPGAVAVQFDAVAVKHNLPTLEVGLKTRTGTNLNRRISEVRQL